MRGSSDGYDNFDSHMHWLNDMKKSHYYCKRVQKITKSTSQEKRYQVVGMATVELALSQVAFDFGCTKTPFISKTVNQDPPSDNILERPPTSYRGRGIQDSFKTIPIISINYQSK